MDSSALIGLIGVGAGLVGAAAGVFAIVWGLGFGEYLGGRRRSKLIAAVSKDELRRRLLALNAADSPYGLKPSEETGLILEWKVVDAKWFALFAKERLKETYRAFMVLDEPRASVRYCEETARVQWTAGTDGLTPNVTYLNEFFRGRILFQKSWRVQYGIKEDRTFGKVFSYSFNVDDVRNPVKKVVKESGWEFVPVVRKSHATHRSLKN